MNHNVFMISLEEMESIGEELAKDCNVLYDKNYSAQMEEFNKKLAMVIQLIFIGCQKVRLVTKHEDFLGWSVVSLENRICATAKLFINFKLPSQHPHILLSRPLTAGT